MACRHLLDGDEIHTIRSLPYFLFHTIPVDREKKSPFLRPSECLDRTSVTLPTSVLDLKKDGDAVLSRDDIDLPSFGRHEIGFRNFVSVFLQILYGEQFGTITGFTRGVGHKNNLSFLRMQESTKYSAGKV